MIDSINVCNGFLLFGQNTFNARPLFANARELKFSLKVLLKLLWHGQNVNYMEEESQNWRNAVAELVQEWTKFHFTLAETNFPPDMEPLEKLIREGARAANIRKLPAEKWWSRMVRIDSRNAKLGIRALLE